MWRWVRNGVWGVECCDIGSWSQLLISDLRYVLGVLVKDAGLLVEDVRLVAITDAPRSPVARV